MCAARMCICADGGANQLYDELPRQLPAAEPDALRTRYAPDAITGQCSLVPPNRRKPHHTCRRHIVAQCISQ